MRQWVWPSPYRSLENIQRMQAAKRRRLLVRSMVKDALLLALGVLSAGFGLRGFIIPNKFIDGGVTGISLLTNQQTGVSVPLLIVLFNIPFLLLGYRQISHIFSLKSIIAIALLALAVAFVPYPNVTSDKLLVALFGGFFLGAGIGLSIRGGGVIDGTEVLAIFLNRRYSLSVGDIILVLNIFIFSVAAYLLSIETAMYSILTYLAASKTVDFILEGIEEYTGVTIISSRSKQVASMIKEKLGWGLTIYSGQRGFGKRGHSDQPVDIIFVVITRLEVNRLNTEVGRIDPQAFIVMQSIRDTRGGMVKKRRLKE
ncbi:YitT family protein [Paracnuella aquatica]|uniref:YitT family protein n=1 Tax=Paracnuella aquatica TaxID=2268757 RepID=UPI000DF000C8|nr:YitT family protein [Paracnuella aquatica]RPD48862.1 YitT family protein [Paracnuella aquatica]